MYDYNIGRKKVSTKYPISKTVCLCNWKNSNILIHHDKMTDAACHDKQMENFMGTEILVSGVKNHAMIQLL